MTQTPRDPSSASAMPAASPPKTKRSGRFAAATAIRRRARDVMEAPISVATDATRRTDGRLLLFGALVLVLTTAFGLYAAVSGLYVAGQLLFGETDWLSPVSDMVYAVLLVLIVLPLAGGTYRMAVRLTAVSCGTPSSLADMDDDPAPPTLSDIFYPFTAASAYGRTMLVAGEALGWFLLIFALPILLYRVAELPLMHLQFNDPPSYEVLTILRPILCVMVGAGMLFLSGCRAGGGYYLFTCPQMTVRDTARYVRSLRRSPLSVLCLRLSFAGWAVLSVVGIGVPFVFHVGPLGLLSAAVYARSLSQA